MFKRVKSIERNPIEGWGMVKHFSFLLPLSSFLLLFLSCSSIDCPMNTTVSTKYGLYKSDGTADTLKDTLTVITLQRIAGHDPVLLNRSVNTTTMDIPISYQSDEDVLYFVRSFPYLYETTVINEEGIEVDTIIRNVTYTRNAIDSIVINNPEVNYDPFKEHFRVYFKSRD